MPGKTNSRFNLLLTQEQKLWLSKKAEGFTSCGDVVRSLIQEAMDKDSSNDQAT
jgi:hypothetical protein